MKAAVFRYFLHSGRRSIAAAPPSFLSSSRGLCAPSKKLDSKLVNFSLPSSDSEEDSDSEKAAPREIDKSKLPPPYNPFDKKPLPPYNPFEVSGSGDPKNLPQVFARLRDDGLMSSAVKMFDGLSREGLTHEALELFSQIKDKAQMPDVVAHTAVIEAYADAGEAKEAHKAYLRMLSGGVLPNAYTYKVIIKALAESGDPKMVKEADKYAAEMAGKGMKPNAETCLIVLEALMEVGMEKEAMALIELLKERKAEPEEDQMKEALKKKKKKKNEQQQTAAIFSSLYGSSTARN
ncbi:hypothetical protein M569_11524 [Genlisea aurea]|uniref:Pentacotripeptide-repeat region of PRORP domain-containing protein n=1 Tax=Genlisea aurea TaxID=192259 RepID=S8DK37_9LAMI|nr:hypothetical protein M569_11524 [Genlisea aurea]